MTKTRKQMLANRRYMARKRADKESNAKLREAAKKCYDNGGNVRQREYLERLKATDFFKWKGRRSYIALMPDELKTLWESQNGLCALTSRKLDDTAELDHVIPISRGGDNSVGNSRWLCRDANQAKRALTDDEFFVLIQEITRSEAYTEWTGRQLIQSIGQ